MSINIASVTITRAEGTINLDSFESMIEANSYLQDMALTAPANGGYHKVDFKVTFEDEETYTGRYDLKQEDMTKGDIADHMRSFVRFNTGQSCPAHMTPEQYEEFISQCKIDTDGWIKFLCIYNF